MTSSGLREQATQFGISVCAQATFPWRGRLLVTFMTPAFPEGEGGPPQRWMRSPIRRSGKHSVVFPFTELSFMRQPCGDRVSEGRTGMRAVIILFNSIAYCREDAFMI